VGASSVTFDGDNTNNGVGNVANVVVVDGVGGTPDDDDADASVGIDAGISAVVSVGVGVGVVVANVDTDVVSGGASVVDNDNGRSVATTCSPAASGTPFNDDIDDDEGENDDDDDDGDV
jgi:hypothetical protein